MAITRRRFAQVAGASVVGFGLLGRAANVFSQSLGFGDLFPLTGEAAADILMTFKSETFAPYIGTIFRSDQSGHSFRLAQVIDHELTKEKSSAAPVESFSLFFRSVSLKSVPQETHTFEHPSLGTFSLFIAPVDRARATYEAVINHTPPA